MGSRKKTTFDHINLLDLPIYILVCLETKVSRFEHLHLRRLTLIDNIIDSRVQFTNCHNNHF